MRLLVIGGTRFVGKHIVEEAVRRGHDVTLFNRGNGPVPSGVARVVNGDRNSDLDRLPNEHFDAVIDTSAYLPRQVRAAATLLVDRVDRYLFISTVSVYADPTIPNQDEGAPLATLPEGVEAESVEAIGDENYGPLKALAEEVLAETYPANRSLVIRPGIIVGPDDPTDRFTYWPVRIADGGEVLAPHGPALALQWIDVRDLAEWSVASLEAGLSGTYNAVSEAGRFTLGEVLVAAKQESGANAEITWTEEEFLLKQGVTPFVDLPLWLPGTLRNMWTIDASRAFANGLRCRPVQETVAATLAWQRERGAPELKFGLSREREREVLGLWRDLKR